MKIKNKVAAARGAGATNPDKIGKRIIKKTNSMKKPIVILSAILISVFACNAQDIIVLKTGEDIQATVIEVNINEVKYRKFGFEGGPVYLQLKTNIVRIKYANGSEDVFSKPEKVSIATEQSETSIFAPEEIDHPARAIYAEAFGNSLIWSLTYDTRFGPSRDGLGGRAGIGFLSFGNQTSYLTVPVMVNYLLGKNENFFELGLGGIIYVSDDRFLFPSESTVIGTLTIGYRYQPVKGGLMAKVAVTPIFGVRENCTYDYDYNYNYQTYTETQSCSNDFYFWPFYAGFSFGYVFP